ncbi:MAG TPA: hypothetical protein VGT04_13545 [Acidobacteriaceae bacterium]|nr:hypothetical protein [Acidobacteriaceae bacterium]
MHSRLRRQFGLAIPALLVFVAGCGVAQYGSVSANGALTVTASKSSVNSNGQVQFSAHLPSGAPAPVTWSVAGGENALTLGEGHIDSTGLYTPPSALSQSAVRVEVAAHLKSDPFQTAGESISVTPGFVQSLLPENASLTVGATLQATAEIAEVNAGDVHWSLTSVPANIADKGTLSGVTCQRSLDQYTTCKVLYTAPESPGPGVIYLSASVNESSTTTKILLDNNGVNSNPVANQSPQTGPIALGSSGGNDNDFDTYRDASGQSFIADCCGGTLGALVEDSQKDQFILSNNHVLAESDQGRAGDAIDQPGMIDDGCVPLSHAGSTLRPVATLKYVVPLATSNTDVDAALAAVTPGAVDSSGSILQLATPTHPVSASDTLAAAPPVAGTGEALTAANLNGLRLAKSGRTTGLTCSSVDAVDLSVKVDYFKDCAETQPYYTKIYTGQIGIAGNRFSDSGDSGALVVDASNAEPVGLFFAGGTDGKGHGLSIANPIGEVLRELGAQTGGGLSIVGTDTPHPVACLRYDSNPSAPSIPVPADLAAHARLVADTSAAFLVNPDRGIFAVSTGASLDSPGQPAIIVYVDKSLPRVSIPPSIEGVRTQVIPTDLATLARDDAPTSPASVNGLDLSATALASAKSVVSQYAPRLLKDPAIFGVGVAQSLDDPQQPALLVLVDPSTAPRSMPATIDGLRVRYMRLHRFHVTRSKYSSSHPAPTCPLKKLTGIGIADRGLMQP